MSKHPPKLAIKLLRIFLREDLQEDVIGDLEEKFLQKKSGLGYWYEVFNYLRPFAMRKKQYHPVTHIDMLKNYLTVGWRNLLKHKMYSAINIGGFALGIAACVLLALYIKGELSYDKFYAHGDRLYRVVGHGVFRSESHANVHFSHPFGDVLKESIPEIEENGYYNPVMNFGAGANEIRRTDRAENVHEERVMYVNQGLLNVLEVKFTRGNPSKALTDPKTVVVTESTAYKYFRNEDPIGKSIIINDDEKKVYEVTGVIKDFPSTSHFNYDFLLTLAGDPFWKGESTSWCCGNYINYVRLKPGVDENEFVKKIAPMIKTYTIADATSRNAGVDEMNWVNSYYYTLQPIGDIYLGHEAQDGLLHGDVRFLWLFGSIAAFILVLACINFINLSTARSANRAKEVGIRKAIGSRRSSVIRQFLAESFLFSLIALIVGLMLTQLMIPIFNNLIGKSISFPWTQWWLIPTLVVAALCIGLIAGIYPAFYLSAFKPVKVLKSGLSTGSRNGSVRSVLVIFQFTISIVLIVGTIVIDRQMSYALNKDLGFEKENLMILNGTITLGNNIIPFKDEVMKLSQVKSATVSNYLPVDDGKRDGGSTNVVGDPARQDISGQQWMVDQDYIKTMGFRIIKGRDFDARIASDSTAMVINESMERALALENPIGTVVSNWSGNFTIVGVVKDFHYHVLTQKIEPVTMFIKKGRANVLAIKLQGGDPASSIEAISAVWKKFSPNQPIRYEFLDDRFTNTYNDVKRFSIVVKVFATLAIVVASLGLFALSAFMIEQRGKEISIRMVLGAPIANILRLLSQNFVMLVGAAFIIAAPVAWMMMDKWLEDYAYKITIGWEVFAVTGISVLLIALITIGYQTIRASMKNPIGNLKSE